MHYTQGELVLHLNAQRIASPITGALDFNWANQTGSSRQNASLNHDLVIGKNFNGRLNSLKWYHLDAAPELTFPDGATSYTATITADGTAPVVIQSTGTMHVAGSALAVQRVAVQSPLIKEYASLVSTASFGQMAGLLNPPMGQSVLAQMGVNVSLFPKAHAGFGDFLWGAINFILPIESFGIVFEQLGYLTGVKDGEFDAVAFGVALVDVLTIFPPAAPFKLVVKPFQAMLKISKRVNPTSFFK